jgi:hypothetical protein
LIEKLVGQVRNASTKNTKWYSISLEGDSTLYESHDRIFLKKKHGILSIVTRLPMIESGDSNVKSGDWVNLNIQHEVIKFSAQENE